MAWWNYFTGKFKSPIRSAYNNKIIIVDIFPTFDNFIFFFPFTEHFCNLKLARTNFLYLEKLSSIYCIRTWLVRILSQNLFRGSSFQLSFPNFQALKNNHGRGAIQFHDNFIYNLYEQTNHFVPSVGNGNP